MSRGAQITLAIAWTAVLVVFSVDAHLFVANRHWSLSVALYDLAAGIGATAVVVAADSLLRGRSGRGKDSSGGSAYEGARQASCDDGATRTCSRTRPLASSTQSVPRSSDGVSTRPAANCTLYEPTGIRVVVSSFAVRSS